MKMSDEGDGVDDNKITLDDEEGAQSYHIIIHHSYILNHTSCLSHLCCTHALDDCCSTGCMMKAVDGNGMFTSSRAMMIIVHCNIIIIFLLAATSYII